jgi:hypothetical protein
VAERVPDSVICWVSVPEEVLVKAPVMLLAVCVAVERMTA